MNESMDHVLADWLDEGPERGPRDGLERALAATRRVPQRPGWTLPERWIPMDMTMTRTRSPRPLLTIVTLAVLLAALLATALYVGQRRSLPASPFSNGAIVFEQDGDLFIADQLGGAPRPLVAGPEEDSDPVFSPLGDRVAFKRYSETGFVSRIMTVDPDGSDVKELAGIESIGVRLAWSPDGSAVLASGNGTYSRDADGEASMGVGVQSWQLNVIQSDGSGSRMIKAGVDGGSSHGAWRPDGRHIAFLGGSDAGIGVYIADADGTEIHRLPISSLGDLTGLEWSPDGEHLSIWGDDLQSGRITIADISADGTITGTTDVPIAVGSATNAVLTWSPDGSHLAFLQSEGSQFRAAVLAPDGSGHRIVGPAVTDLYGSAGVVWSPDGRSLVVSGHVLQEDPETRVSRWTEMAWLVDVATGESTDVSTPVDSWQRIAE